jgi:exonuclease SbcC
LITSVVLENFQSHKYSVFNFDKGLNVIVGSSNQGKTSLARALLLVLYNIWDKSWVRVGASFCRVTLATDSGIIVIREKGDKTNKYILKVPGQVDQEFSNFGVDVPDVISKALKIEKVVLDKDDSLALNMASQLEPLFLFNRSGSQKAKVFGRLSGAHYLDHALRNLNTEKKQISVEKNLKTRELEDLKTQVDTLKQITSFEGLIQELEIKNNDLDVGRQRVEALKSLFLEAQDWKRRYTSEIDKENVFGHLPFFQIEFIASSVERLKSLKQLLSQKNDLLIRENALNNTKNQLNYDFQTTGVEYLKILNENKTCPTCFSPIDEQRIEDIKNNLIGNGI